MLAAMAASCAFGQTWQFAGEWRFMDAGRVDLKWAPGGASMNLTTVGFVRSLYQVDHSYSVTYDKDFCASASLFHAEEGKRRRESRVTFNGRAGKAEYLERDLLTNTVARSSEVAIPACVSDILAGLAKLRTLALSPGQETSLPISDGRKSASVRVVSQKRETIRTPAGVFPCIQHEVYLMNDVIFRRRGRLYIWLSDDARRLPAQIRVQLPFYVGTVTLQLIKELPD